MNELVKRNQEMVPAQRQDISQTTAIEVERAVAEAQAKLMLAKRFPRHFPDCYARIMEACHRKSLAEKALYTYKRGETTVTGPSIRLAEEIARSWENFECGVRELSNRDGESEVEAYAWDLERNVMDSKRFVVKHERRARGSITKLDDARDVYELVANMGARRKRACILAVVPADVVEDAVAEVKRTLADVTKGTLAEPLVERMKKVVRAFSKYNVTPELLEQYLGHTLEHTTEDEYIDIGGVFNAIKDGAAKPSDYFNLPKRRTPSERAQAATHDVLGTVPADEEPDYPTVEDAALLFPEGDEEDEQTS